MTTTPTHTPTTTRRAARRVAALAALCAFVLSACWTTSIDYVWTRCNPQGYGWKATVGMLYEATDGDLGRSPMYTNLYAELGVADELRAAFITGSRCWGVVSLLRASEDGPFPDEEVRLVENLAPMVARALQRC